MNIHQNAILKAKRLTRACGTTDPYKIAEKLGIRISYMNLCSIKGMYAYILQNRFIVLDNKLDAVEQRILLAHEIGHDQLDRGSWFQALTDRNSISYANHHKEMGANYFSAQLLIPDGDFFNMFENRYDYSRIAAELRVFPELLMLKINILNMQGHRLAPVDLGPMNIPKWNIVSETDSRKIL